MHFGPYMRDTFKHLVLSSAFLSSYNLMRQTWSDFLKGPPLLQILYQFSVFGARHHDLAS